MTGPDQMTRLMVLQRDDWRCLRCGNDLSDLSRGGGDIHHRCPRRAGGTTSPMINLPSNLVTLCRDCHRYAELYRVQSIAENLVLSDVSQASSRPVWRGWHRGWWVLTDDGRRYRLTDTEVEYYVNEGLIEHPDPIRRGESG